MAVLLNWTLQMANHAKLAFFGTDEFSATTLKALIQNGYHIDMVITKPDAPIGRKRIITAPIVKTIAQSHNIPVLQPQRAVDLLDTLQHRCEAGIVVSYGKILPQAVLDLFPLGLINVHASLLPKYRGASPIEAALLNGDATTGISLMKLEAGMDTGPVYIQAEYEIASSETAATLYPELAAIGADLLVRELDAILDGSLTPKTQNEATATHVGMINKTDGIIDWTKTATEIDRQIRAFVVWPGSKATIANTEVTITSASIISPSVISSEVERSEQGLSSPVDLSPGRFFKTESVDLAVFCGEGILQIDTLIPAGKRQMTGREFLTGHSLV